MSNKELTQHQRDVKAVVLFAICAVSLAVAFCMLVWTMALAHEGILDWHCLVLLASAFACILSGRLLEMADESESDSAAA